MSLNSETQKKILFIERKFWGFVSIEKIFEQIARELAVSEFNTEFQKVNYDNNLTGIFKNLLHFRKRPADVYHITGHIHYMALVLPPDRTILTVHDLGFLHYRRGLRRMILKKLFLEWPLRRLRYVTAISETTKSEILEHLRCDENKILVIENPLQSQYLTPSKRDFNRSEPVMLQVGTLGNKNIERLIAALTGLKCRLRIVGHITDAQRVLLERSQVKFENVFELDDNGMRREYDNADIVTFCSTYEGFGMPIIEAQAVGRAVVTSNISPLKEVAGQGACLVDPFDSDHIRAGLKRMIEDEVYRAETIANGFDNVRRFQPEKIAEQYRQLYLKVIHEKEMR